MALTEAKKRANKKYYEKNKDKEILQGYFRSGRLFVRKTDDLKKLEELKTLIEEKIKELSSNK